MKYSVSLHCAGTDVGIITSEKKFPERNAGWASEGSNETVSRPDVKYDEDTGSEECVSEDTGRACCRTRIYCRILQNIAEYCRIT